MIRSVGVALIFSLAVMYAAAAAAQTNSAVVTGTEGLLLRRGPGAQFAPFATLASGTTVEVQEMRGEWARVVTAGGQVGYVKSNYLTLHGEKSRHTPARSVTPAVPAATPAHAALATLEERNRDLEAEIQRLRDNLAAAEARAAATPVATLAPTAGIPATSEPGNLTGSEPLQAELHRLTALVEALQTRLDERTPDPAPPLPLGAPFQEPPRAVSPAAVLLGIGGLGVGWIMGSMLGRREDRGRRSRVRF
jgi:uncharacterized protein YraI